MQGQVFRVIAGFYDIVTPLNQTYRVRGAGKLRQQSLSPCVGDIVEFEPAGLISKIYERKNILMRPKVANVDQVVVVTALKEPNYSSLLINKLLSIIEFNQIECILLFTKEDLSTQKPYQEYEKMGYQVFVINNHNYRDVAALNQLLKNKLTVFTGQTGVGKSSIIANLTNVKLKTQPISQALGRGKHTTRVVEIIPWTHGKLIDTPGFSSFNVGLKPQELAQSFAIFRKFAAACKFRNCLHFKETNCGIKHQVKLGQITQQRYQDYLKLLQEALDE